MQKKYLSAKEASELLGIQAATLYSYVSRGLIRSAPSSDDTRERQYNAEDIQRLVKRKEQRRDPAKAASSALQWGAPVLESELTLITEGDVYYRGQSATYLAKNYSFEDVVSLLWTGDIGNSGAIFRHATSPLRVEQWRTLPAVPIIQRMQMALALASEGDLRSYDLSKGNVNQTGVRILHLLVQVLTNTSVTKPTIAENLAESWRIEPARILNMALILCADHELNASSFTARVIASAGSNPYAVVTGALSALQGYKHGGHTQRVAGILREVEERGDPRIVIRERIQQGEQIPGFGHRLYPQGDPRAICLLNRLQQDFPDHPALRMGNAIIEETRETLDLEPTIDFALVLMERLLNLPAGSALGIFALGRTAGWIAHASEQYETDSLIRPRAKYTGLPPVKHN